MMKVTMPAKVLLEHACWPVSQSAGAWRSGGGRGHDRKRLMERNDRADCATNGWEGQRR